MERVAVVRAVGVVFSETGTDEQRSHVKPWLRALLHDPAEKVRRYAMAALPKLGADAEDEAALLELWRTTTSEREKAALAETLEKIGGTATLREITSGAAGQFAQAEQKVKASVARSERPSVIRTDTVLPDFAGLRIRLRGRSGLEEIVRNEVEEYSKAHGKFRVCGVRRAVVEIEPTAPFSLGDLYSLRCFGTLSFVLGTVENVDEEASSIEMLAQVITSPTSQRLLETFTEGSLRYRLDFVGKGHQRGAVRLVANRAYALCPEILNDARNAPWTIAIHPTGRGSTIELSPRLSPDPRFTYRQQDVPAASHPPLAACMARIAGPHSGEVVWDPFCGSGLELIERSLRGGVKRVFGTDLSADAIGITKKNFAAARVKSVDAKFICCDFRDFAKIEGLGPDTVTLVITNPPMGKRVPIPNLRGLMEDLFSVASTVLQPGGRLVFANPLRLECRDRSLKLLSRQTVDFGGFNCRLEVYRKV
jgi:23S rRNA G2445 N2-methylase RlmL